MGKQLQGLGGVFLRIGLGVVFTYHGFGKVFGDGVGLGSSWNPHGMPALMQVLVSWGEFVGGIAFLVGFLTQFAALGISIIMIGAIVTVHGANGFSSMNQGYEYNFVLIMMCLALISTGSGPMAIDKK